MKKIWVDDGYKEGFVEFVEKLTEWKVEKITKNIREQGIWHAENKVEEKKVDPKKTKFEVLPKRWVVERTFGWLGRYRRLSKDYESKGDTAKAWMWIAMSRILLYRMASP